MASPLTKERDERAQDNFQILPRTDTFKIFKVDSEFLWHHNVNVTLFPIITDEDSILVAIPNGC